jgi:hypothetical protein
MGILPIHKRLVENGARSQIYPIVLTARPIALSRFDYFPLTGSFDSKYALM